MSDFFEFVPTVEILSQLAKDSLKQNLAKAVRLWVILDSLYSDRLLELDQDFSLYEWLDKFFPGFETVHKQDTVKYIKFHHSQCPCQKSLKDWLLQHLGEKELDDWKQTFLERYIPISVTKIEELLTQKQLFAVSRRSIQNDFNRLCELGWLQAEYAPNDRKDKIIYRKVLPFPPSFGTNKKLENTVINTINLVNNDLSDFFEDFGAEINGKQRFFLDLEYIIHQRHSSHIDQLRQSLKHIWKEDTITPIQLDYFSARKYQDSNNAETYFTYPVCLYYSQRVPYLFAYGQTPHKNCIDWYDFRLDRINSLNGISWDSIDLKKHLENFRPEERHLNTLENRLIKNSNLSERIKIYQRYCQGLSPQSIHDLKTEAWGFDFFRPKQTMILRFDRYFHSRYIQGTEREQQFQQISFKDVQYFIQNNHQVEQHQYLLQKLQIKSRDIYCRIDYREGDYNVIMRLRAWGSNVEVLAPTTLRNEMSKEFQKLAVIYA